MIKRTTKTAFTVVSTFSSNPIVRGPAAFKTSAAQSKSQAFAFVNNGLIVEGSASIALSFMLRWNVGRICLRLSPESFLTIKRSKIQVENTGRSKLFVTFYNNQMFLLVSRELKCSYV